MQSLGSNVMRKGCLIGLASVGHHSWKFTQSLIHSDHPLNYAYGYMWVVKRSLTDAYNLIFHAAKLGGYEYIFLREEDTIAPSDAWTRLVNRLERNPHITAVTGIYPRKMGGDLTPFIYRGNLHGPYVDWKWGEFFEVTGIPFGCTMIRTADLAKLDPLVGEVDIPNYPVPGVSTRVKEYCRMNVEQQTADGTRVFLESQDIYFSELCQRAGLKLFADASVNCTHFDLNSEVEYVIPEYLHNGWKAPEGKTAVNVGSGSEFGLVHGVQPVRVDWREQYEPDYRMDVRDMAGLASESFDYVRCAYVLPNYTDADAMRILQECVRLAKPGGEIQIVVPDVTGALEMLQQGDEQDRVWWALYGPGAEYRSGYTPEKLGRWLKQLGLTGGALAINETFGAKLCVRAFKPPQPDFAKGWIHLDKSDWDEARFFDEDTRAIRLNGFYMPVAPDVKDEDIEAYFAIDRTAQTKDGETVYFKNPDPHEYMGQMQIADRLHQGDAGDEVEVLRDEP